MATRTGIEVSIAVADAVKMANADVIAAYPITPQTHIVEHLAELVRQRRARRRVHPGGVRALGDERLPGLGRGRAPAPLRRPPGRAWS